MTLNWGDYRTMIRRTILKDEAATPQFPNTSLADGLGWALDAFCAHTAAASNCQFTGDGTTATFTLPDNMYAGVDEAGLVFTSSTSAAVLQYLIPVFKTPGALESDTKGFYVWNQNQLICLTPPGSGVFLKVLYYACYNKPSQDSDLIGLPSWALGPVAYLTAAHVLSGKEALESQQRVSQQRPETGTPDLSSIRMNIDHFRRIYEDELKRHLVQDRRYLHGERR